MATGRLQKRLYVLFKKALKTKYKHIVIVVDSIDINDSSGSKANVALIKNLIAIGYKISVYHYTRKEMKLLGANCFAIKEKKGNLLYILSRSQRIIQRVFKINLAKHLEPVFGFSFTFFNDVNSIKATLKKVDVTSVDAILTLSKAASFRPHYAVNKIPKLYDKWIAYMHDPYPFSCYPEPYDWKEPGYKKKEQFFKKLSNNATYSAFPSLLLKQWMGTFFSNFNNTGIVIPHQASEMDTYGIELPEYFNKEKFTVLHAGSLMKQRDPEGLIKGFQLFLKNNPNAKKDARLMLLGYTADHKKMITGYLEKMPTLYAQFSSVPFTEVFLLQHHVSVNVILEADAEISPFLPGKFPHCVAANKPILHLGSYKSETKRLLGNTYAYHSGIYEVKKIALMIEELYLSWKINPNSLKLNRLDLMKYLGEEELKINMDKLLS